ncbi:uncharacterized protein si:ch73-63e15.2 [Boleophthalmus pectinirostris]|uniref:uncharacterized protein si:ch73-63e15.2 n=1 Tax=Boleophthalmus pectinirostris TaxID=150288 RepID=UPI00242F1814|nr:uncharacterized protein si:ch73-63e15.2 [Boleophthalmus pectinirostris]
MPTLPSALAMDGESYLHPDGSQLDSSLFSTAPSNMESSLFASSGSWGPYSQSNGYSIHCPMQTANQQYHLNSSSSSTPVPEVHMDMYSGFSDVDFSGLALPRNGDFTQHVDRKFIPWKDEESRDSLHYEELILSRVY